MTRAITPTVQVNSNVTTEDNQFDKKKNNDVTVNGISLMEIMRAKKTTTSLKTTKRKMTARNKNKKDNTPTPPTNNIRKQVGLSRATLESQVKAFHFDPAELPSKIIQWVNNSTCLELTSPDLT